MKQENIVKIASEDKKIILLADADTSLGLMHDFLLSVKGEVVARILKAQEEEVTAANEVKKEEQKSE